MSHGTRDSVGFHCSVLRGHVKVRKVIKAKPTRVPNFSTVEGDPTKINTRTEMLLESAVSAEMLKGDISSLQMVAHD